MCLTEFPEVDHFIVENDSPEFVFQEHMDNARCLGVHFYGLRKPSKGEHTKQSI